MAHKAFDRWPYDVIALLISYVPLVDYYPLKLAGHRPLTDAIRHACSRISRAQYLDGRPDLIRYYKGKYKNDPYYANRENYCSQSILANARMKKAFTMALHWAAYYGQEHLALELMDCVNLRAGPTFGTPLHYAAKGDRVAMIELRLEHGAYINDLDNYGQTPLAVAVSHQAKSAAEDLHSIYLTNRLLKRCWPLKATLEYYFLKGHATQKQIRQARSRVVREATMMGEISVVEFMIDEGWDVNSYNPGGFTPLACAAYHNRADTTELLLNHGADPTVTPERYTYLGMTPLHIALYRRSGSVVSIYRFLGLAVNITNIHGETAFHLAARLTWITQEVVSYLLLEGLDINQGDCNGNTFLHVACQTYRLNVKGVNLLLQAGANIDRQNIDGLSPLLYMISAPMMIRALTTRSPTQRGSLLTVSRILLETGATLDIQGNDAIVLFDLGLESANAGGASQLVLLLVNRGFDVTLRDEHGRTRLHRAVISNLPYVVVQILVQNGVDINAPDDKGRTALYYTCCDPAACVAESRDMCDFLVGFDANLDVQDNNGATPLHLALENDRVAFIRCLLLLGLGADLRIVDSEGRTPLMYLSKLFDEPTSDTEDLLELCVKLLRYGCDPEILDHHGQSIIDSLMMRRFRESGILAISCR
ncbi:ankyrin repeat-containing domain protein [Aspergillus crustosus]